MRNEELVLDNYDTDKIISGYMKHYDALLESLRNKEIKLLELGIYKGESLLLWRDYFPMGTIVGIDINLPRDFTHQERIYIYEGSQSDKRFLSDVADKIAPDGFDIIIDDASHIGELTEKTFWHLFDNHLRPGGLYVIEDWGTGYWDDWPDGKSIRIYTSFLSKLRYKLLSRINSLFMKPFKKTPFNSHNYGMVGFIKTLIDEQGAADLTKTRSSDKPGRKSKFSQMVITHGLVFIQKARF